MVRLLHYQFGTELAKVNLSYMKERILKVEFFSGIVIAAYGTGQLRIFAIPSGLIVAEVAAHANWITGMDLAAVSGLLVTISEDGFMRVINSDLQWQFVFVRY